MRRLFAALAFLWASASASAAPVNVTIAQGDLVGAQDGAIASFKNIPYAAPPLGPLRWRAPQPAPHWPEPRDASAFGPACPQNATDGLAARANLPQSEDCLTLNVWTPDARAGAKLPVMVWIHGGGFDQGSAAIPRYDGASLARHGVVMVSLNYRLGRLGFFALPAMQSEHPGEPSANFALLDQIAALHWVRDNIQAFGGDPANVTIFGESAGGVSVDALMASPLARGLFVHAIAESAPAMLASEKLADAERRGAAFAWSKGVDVRRKDALAKLRALPVSALIGGADSNFTPIIDGQVLPRDPSIAFATGEAAKIPYLAGSNDNEASLIGANSSAFMIKGLGAQARAVRAVYEKTGKLSNEQFGRALFTDQIFAFSAQGFATFAQRAGAPAYVYQFTFQNAVSRGRTAGVGHGGELLFVFGLGPFAAIAPKADADMVDLVESYWTNFAKTGDPNGAGLPPWPRFAPPHPKTLVLGDATSAVTDFKAPELDFAYSQWSKETHLPAPH